MLPVAVWSVWERSPASELVMKLERRLICDAFHRRTSHAIGPSPESAHLEDVMRYDNVSERAEHQPTPVVWKNTWSEP